MFSDIEDFFASTDEDKEVSSCMEDEIVDSEDESCSPNGTTVVTTKATVVEDVSQVTPTLDQGVGRDTLLLPRRNVAWTPTY